MKKAVNTALGLGFSQIQEGVYTGNIFNIHDEIKLLKAIVNDAKLNPKFRKLATHIINSYPCQSHNYDCYAKAIYDWVKKNIKYIKDITGYETIQSPEKTLEIGGGDCDDHAVLVATLLESIGMKTAFKVVGWNGDYRHVYVIATTPQGKRWVIDTTVKNGFYPLKKDRSYEMEILSGTGLGFIGIPYIPPRKELKNIKIESKNLKPAVAIFTKNIQSFRISKQLSKRPCIHGKTIYAIGDKLYVKDGCRAYVDVTLVEPGHISKVQTLDTAPPPQTPQPTQPSLYYITLNLGAYGYEITFDKPIVKLEKVYMPLPCGIAPAGFKLIVLPCPGSKTIKVYFNGKAKIVNIKQGKPFQFSQPKPQPQQPSQQTQQPTQPVQTQPQPEPTQPQPTQPVQTQPAQQTVQTEQPAPQPAEPIVIETQQPEPQQQSQEILQTEPVSTYTPSYTPSFSSFSSSGGGTSVDLTDLYTDKVSTTEVKKDEGIKIDKNLLIGAAFAVPLMMLLLTRR